MWRDAMKLCVLIMVMLVMILIGRSVIQMPWVFAWVIMVPLGAVVGFFFWQWHKQQLSVWTVMLLCSVFALLVFFDSFFEQFGAAFNLFVDAHANRQMGSLALPSQWLLALNPVFIIAIYSLVTKASTRLSMHANLAYSFLLLALGFWLIVFGAWLSIQMGWRLHVLWFAAALFIFSVGETVMIPLSQTLFADHAPEQLQSRLMGLWWLAPAFAHFISRYLAVDVTRAWVGASRGQLLQSFMASQAQLGLWILVLVALISVVPLVVRRLVIICQIR